MQARTIDQQFNDSYKDSGLQPSYRNQNKGKVRNISVSEESSGEEITKQSTIARPSYIQKNTANSIKNIKIDAVDVSKLDKARARGINIFIRASGLQAWLMFQLPFAIFSIVFLGLAAGVSTLKDLLGINYDPKNIADQLDKIKGDATESVINSVLNYTVGIDLSWFDINNLFFISYLVVFLFGIITIFGIFLIYKVAGLNPVFGDRGGGAKFVIISLTIIGYSIPFLNLFPWFFFWTMAVQRYPK